MSDFAFSRPALPVSNVLFHVLSHCMATILIGRRAVELSSRYILTHTDHNRKEASSSSHILTSDLRYLRNASPFPSTCPSRIAMPVSLCSQAVTPTFCSHRRPKAGPDSDRCAQREQNDEANVNVMRANKIRVNVERSRRCWSGDVQSWHELVACETFDATFSFSSQTIERLTRSCAGAKL